MMPQTAALHTIVTENDLIRWVASLSSEERRLALAASTMPDDADHRLRDLGCPAPDGEINRFAAGTAALWAADGAERLGGDWALWKLGRRYRALHSKVRSTGDTSDLESFEAAHGRERLNTGIDFDLLAWIGPEFSPRWVRLFSPYDDPVIQYSAGIDMPWREAAMRAIATDSVLRRHGPGYCLYPREPVDVDECF